MFRYLSSHKQLKGIALLTLILLSLVMFIEFVPDSTATISDHPCAPSNDICDWKSKIIYKFYFVYPLSCDEGHIHGEQIGVIRKSWIASWCAYHTDLWTEPPTFLDPGIMTLYSGSCPDQTGPSE